MKLGYNLQGLSPVAHSHQVSLQWPSFHGLSTQHHHVFRHRSLWEPFICDWLHSAISLSSFCHKDRYLTQDISDRAGDTEKGHYISHPRCHCKEGKKPSKISNSLFVCYKVRGPEKVFHHYLLLCSGHTCPYEGFFFFSSLSALLQ